MSALPNEPWRGNAVVRVTNGNGTRHFRLSTNVRPQDASDTGTFDGDNAAGHWDGAPGDIVHEDPATVFFGEVSLTWDTTNQLSAPPQANWVHIKAFLPGTNTQVGSTRSISISGNEGVATVGFRFDSDPFDGDHTNDAIRAGMVEWFIEVVRDSGVDQWGPATSRGTFTNSGVGRDHDWARGYARAYSTLVSHTVSNVSMGGAEPALFAYPDPVYIEYTTDTRFYGSDTHEAALLQGGTVLRKDGQFTSGTTIQSYLTTNSERIDSDFTVGSVDLMLQLDADSFGGDTEYTWGSSGHEAGWTVKTDTREIQYDGRFSVDPSLSIVSESLDNPATDVFNRGESQGGSFQVLNARDETFTPLGTETVKVIRVADGAEEETATVTRATGTTNWDVTFNASGNTAPADTTGDQKRLQWDDVAAGVTTPKPTTAPIGYLSSLVDVVDVLTDHESSTETVYNRGESATVTGKILNRRGEPFQNFSAEVFESIDQGTSAVEETATINTHDTGTGEFNLTVDYATTGNVAPADTTGARKLLSWSDSSGNVADGDVYAYLSSLLETSIHLQTNVDQLDPALHDTQRLTSDLGFYSIGIFNQRGQGKNGVSVTDHLQDDKSLVDIKTRTDTTGTQNGNAGYLPLKAWDSALPGGGWDHWIDAGTFEGNTFERPRSAGATAEYTLLAVNPNLVAVTAGGHNTAGEDGLHWSSGNELLVGCALFNITLNDTIPVDDDPVALDPGGQPYPRAYMIIARFNNQTGAAQFYDSDKTWTDVESAAGNIYQWQLMSIRRANELQAIGSVGDERTYVKEFSAADTEGWGEADLFFIPVVYKNSTPYTMWGLTGVTGRANSHGGNELDATGLALHGVLGFK